MQKRTVIYRIKKGTQKAAHSLTASFMIFFVLIFLSITFILFQLKEFQITRYFKDIRSLKNEIEELESANHHYRSKIDNELATHTQIFKLANQLGLQESLEQPQVLHINKDKLRKYVEKDQKISR